ncbi:hypothetical protein [Pontibacter litorisediminis]|uniref:hypothetical protein n=1 Tax=Pontibacter litorisediminis TaxID=1846260 RepID=UPI0023EC8A6D|nr:hypothetical protein [Pontibacter litorisediminis]
MKDLQRLVKIIDTYSPSATPLLNLQDETIMETKLFNLLKEGQVCSDEEIAQALYGSSKAAASYRMLKSRFRRKLLNHIHFLDLTNKDLGNRLVITQQCLSLLHEANFLYSMSEGRMADKLLDQMLDLAERYELTDQKVKALELKQQICMSLRDERKYKINDEELLKAQKVRDIEAKAQRTYQLLMLQHHNSVKSRGQMMEQYPKVLQDLRESWHVTGASCVYFYYNLLRNHYLELQGDYKSILEAVEETERLHLEGKLNDSWYSMLYNNYSKVYALLQVRDYERGLIEAAKHLKNFTPHSYNWYAFMENYLLLAIHGKQNELMIELLGQALVNNQYTKISVLNREKYEVIRRYVVLVLRSEYGGEQLHQGKKFTEHLTILPKDKSGFNLALLVLDVLEKLSCGELDDLEPQAERVRKYAQKYLKGEKAERPRLFLRLLLLALTKQDAALAREQGQKLLERLKGTPLPGDAFAEVEIVPYEHLWEYTLAILEKNNNLR